MATLNVLRSFQFRGKIYKAGELPEDSTIKISKAELEAEIAKGKHKSGKWLSGLLNHCKPADAEARKVMGGEEDEEEDPEATEAEIEATRAEFDRIGKSYHKGWKLPRLKTELIKAKKEKGE